MSDYATQPIRMNGRRLAGLPFAGAPGQTAGPYTIEVQSDGDPDDRLVVEGPAEAWSFWGRLVGDSTWVLLSGGVEGLDIGGAAGEWVSVEIKCEFASRSDAACYRAFPTIALAGSAGWRTP